MKWEYKTRLASRAIGLRAVDDMLRMMDELGWELVTCTDDFFVFRRPVSS